MKFKKKIQETLWQTIDFHLINFMIHVETNIFRHYMKITQKFLLKNNINFDTSNLYNISKNFVLFNL